MSNSWTQVALRLTATNILPMARENVSGAFTSPNNIRTNRYRPQKDFKAD